MCDICYSTPCHPRCPNAPEEEEQYEKCSVCNQEIKPGVQYLDAEDGMICKDCIDEMSVGEVIEACGCYMTVA